MAQKPNLLFVFSDQHRFRDLGCYGNTQVHSPCLDAFAGESLRFAHCVSNVPVCVPMRGSMLTGRMPLGHGALTNDFAIRPETPSIATVLNEAGYHTGYIGKWHLGGIPRDKFIPAEERLGFTEWKAAECNHSYNNDYYDDENDVRHPIEGYDAVTQTDLAIDFMKRNKSAKPWAAVLSWGPPHDPYDQCPPEDRALYNPDELVLPPNVRFPVQVSPKFQRDEWQLREALAGYYGHITALDRQFGRLVDTLKATGQWENTVVVYTSDHGDMLGSHGVSNKQFAYDESMLVPLMVHGPGVRWGVTQEMISLVDLPVTLMGLLGLHFQTEVEGLNLAALFGNDTLKGPDVSYACVQLPCHQAFGPNQYAWRAVRSSRFTYCLAMTPEGVDADEYSFLFDNEKDPWQMNNCLHTPAYAEVKAVLHERLMTLCKQYDAPLPWEDFARHFGYVLQWNLSQRHFRLEPLDDTGADIDISQIPARW